MTEARAVYLEDSASEVSSDESVGHYASSAESSDAEDFEGVPVMAMAFNISKGIVGEGILSLPAGIAAGTGIVPALVVMTAFCVVMMYSFWSIGRCCEATGGKTHGDVGMAVLERGGRCFGGTMEVVNLLKTTMTCTAYALVIGKNSADVWTALDVHGSWFVTARGSFLTVLVVILLPLCLLRDLSKLAFSSFFGLACEAGVVVFMIVRLVTGEYAPGGEFYNSQEPGTQLSWGDGDGPEILAFDWSVFVLIGSMSTAFLAHYNATAGGYSIAVLLFATCMIVGYLTFGTNCQGNILHNYSPHDTWATVSRVAMLLATICGFPIAFTGLRTAALQLCGCGHRRRYWVPITVGLLSIIGLLGSVLTDLGIVNSLGGATLGSLIELIFPGLMIMWTFSASQSKETDVTEVFGRFEGRHGARLLTGLGVALLCFGTSIVLAVTVFKMDL
ncbi:Sodium-coupled neutral amino acid transporter 1 (Amino acid transporter A1) (rATA1) (Glutamine transporter) (N-system amino acid transporter 2) (Solute carrier family 38 member 1) (System A amino acid transporter 1) (System A transporter 2) (System N amino acid transporter 1) [Durusdinium trenchii]|uniref:Amino acid transporter transmembrane domain-containing protein n=1 Tax=Durusdinium trenchii TaxID=1381693 RepID=A0ABP0N6A3_9DINO